MLTAINVRFFAYALDRVESLECIEVTEDCFKELAAKKGSSISYERHDVFTNGVRQVCLTVDTPDLPDAEDLVYIQMCDTPEATGPRIEIGG
jgi:hypothetical protein